MLDPIKKVCLPRLEMHWEEKYKQRFPGRALRWLVFDLVLLILASALSVGLVLVYTVLPEIYFMPPVAVSLRQPAVLISGQPTELVIEYVSGSDYLVRDAELIAELDENFVVTDAGAADHLNPPFTVRGQQRIYDLGHLAPHARGTIRLSGQAFVSPGQSLPLTVRLSYWESGRAKRTESAAYYELPAADSPLQIEMNFTEPFLTDTVNALTVDYKYEGTKTLPGAVLRLVPPPGFRVTGARPALNWQKEWRLGNLPPQSSGQLVAYGILSPQSTPSFSVTALALAPDGVVRPINQIHRNADAASTGFRLLHDLAGLTTLAPGQRTPVTVTYANTGQQMITDVEVTLQVQGAYVAEESAVLSWTASEFAELAQLEPGAVGQLVGEIELVDFLTQEELQGEVNPTVTVQATSQYSLADSPERIFRTDSQVSELPVSTSLRLDAASIYYTKSGDQLGVGPLPPRAGETTNLWVVLSVENGPNPMSGVVLTANLLPGVQWTGRTSVTAGRPLAYVSSDRRLIWEIDELPAFTGGHLPRATANFEIQVQPDEDVTTAALKLLDHIIIEGVDEFTGARVRAISPAVTSEVR